MNQKRSILIYFCMIGLFGAGTADGQTPPHANPLVQQIRALFPDFPGVKAEPPKESPPPGPEVPNIAVHVYAEATVHVRHHSDRHGGLCKGGPGPLYRDSAKIYSKRLNLKAAADILFAAEVQTEFRIDPMPYAFVGSAGISETSNTTFMAFNFGDLSQKVGQIHWASGCEDNHWLQYFQSGGFSGSVHFSFPVQQNWFVQITETDPAPSFDSNASTEGMGLLDEKKNGRRIVIAKPNTILARTFKLAGSVNSYRTERPERYSISFKRLGELLDENQFRGAVQELLHLMKVGFEDESIETNVERVSERKNRSVGDPTRFLGAVAMVSSTANYVRSKKESYLSFVELFDLGQEQSRRLLRSERFIKLGIDILQSRERLNSLAAAMTFEQLDQLHEALLSISINPEPVESQGPHENALIRSLAMLLDYNLGNAVAEVFGSLCSGAGEPLQKVEMEQLVDLLLGFKLTSLNIMMHPAPSSIRSPFEPVRAAYVDEIRTKRNIETIEACFLKGWKR